MKRIPFEWKGSGLAPVQHDVGVEVARDLVGAVEPQPPGGAHLRQAWVGGAGVGGLGRLALQAEHDGLDRAVPVAGGAERAEQLGPHPAHLLEHAGRAQALPRRCARPASDPRCASWRGRCPRRRGRTR